jgi:Rrf2 family protein
MNITSKSKYALRAMIHLAQKGSATVRREDLALAQGGISKESLEKILLRLREANIVEAKSGRGGGYRLARSSDELTAWDIISAVEDSPQPVSCLGDSPNSCMEKRCGAKSLWKRVWEAAVNEMKSARLASLVEEELDTFGTIHQHPNGEAVQDNPEADSSLSQCH